MAFPPKQETENESQDMAEDSMESAAQEVTKALAKLMSLVPKDQQAKLQQCMSIVQGISSGNEAEEDSSGGYASATGGPKGIPTV